MAFIIDYKDQYHAEFKSLNLEWLERYNLVESHDLEVLDHPQQNVIDKGGYIFLLIENDVVIGTAGLYKINTVDYELIKMCVAQAARGKKFGLTLLNCCVEKAKKLNARKLILYSNSHLQTAIRIYEQFGFKHVPVEDTPFETADIKMELQL